MQPQAPLMHPLQPPTVAMRNPLMMRFKLLYPLQAVVLCFYGSQDPFNLVDASTLALMLETCNVDSTQATSLLGQPVMVEIGRKMSAVGSRKFCRPTSTPVVDADALLTPADL